MSRKRNIDPDQQCLPYSGLMAEQMALIRQLEYADIPGMSAGRRRGVAELLQRLLLMSRDGSQDTIEVRASVSVLAAKIQPRSVVGERTVRYWAKDAEALGILERDILSARYGGKNWNLWKFQLSTVRQLGCRGLQGPATVAAPGPATVAAPKRDVFKGSINTVPGPEEPAPDFVSFERSQTASIATATRQRSARSLRDALLRDVPQLQAAAHRPLKPLPTGEFTYNGHGVFARLQFEHLGKSALVYWHCEMISADQDFCGNTEADLLLTLAASRHVLDLPQAEIIKNRVAAFVSLITRGNWHKAVPKLPWACATLEQYAASNPNGRFWVLES